MRKVRGIQNLIDYLASNNIPISKYTIEQALRRKSIPASRPTPRVLIFDLDEIDAWISGEKKAL